MIFVNRTNKLNGIQYFIYVNQFSRLNRIVATKI